MLALRHIAKVRRQKTYLEEYNNFEEYCQAEWERSRRQIDRLLDEAGYSSKRREKVERTFRKRESFKEQREKRRLQHQKVERTPEEFAVYLYEVFLKMYPSDVSFFQSDVSNPYRVVVKTPEITPDLYLQTNQ